MTRPVHRARAVALVAAVTLFGIVGLAGAASAHVTIAESQVTAGSYAILTFGLPHGCGESAVTDMRIQIPEEVVSITPTRNANWEVDKVMEELVEPITGSHGETITERVSEVVYTAITPLPNGYRDVFELSLRVPEESAGTTLYFPTVQVCEEGETAWIQIPDEGQDPFELDEPSPFVAVVAGDDAGHGHGTDDDHSHDPSEEDADGTASDEADESAGEASDGSDEARTASTETAAVSVPGDTDGGDGGSDALSIVALVVGCLGAVLGGAALVRGRTS